MNTDNLLCRTVLFIPFFLFPFSSFSFRLNAQGRKHIQNMKRIINRVKQQQLLSSSASSSSSVLTSSAGSALHSNNKQKKQIDYQFHYDKMKSLLGEETHEKYQKILLQQEKENQPEEQTKEFPRVLENEHDENFTKPERDLRAIQYDPCSEYYTYRKKKNNLVITLFFISFSLFSVLFFYKYI
jgi:uncharacterized protein YcfL